MLEYDKDMVNLFQFILFIDKLGNNRKFDHVFIVNPCIFHFKVNQFLLLNFFLKAFHFISPHKIHIIIP